MYLPSDTTTTEEPGIPPKVVCSYARFQHYQLLRSRVISAEVLRQQYEDAMIEFDAGGFEADLHRAARLYTCVSINELNIAGIRASLGLAAQPKESRHEQAESYL